MIIKYRPKQTYEYYTETENGIETIIGRKMCKHPDKIKMYLDMQKRGFVNGVHSYGFRKVELSTI